MGRHVGRLGRAGGGAWHELPRSAGGPLRVRFAIPGEKILVAERDEDPGHADLLEVLEPSPHRREAACAHFGSCGGCQLLHVSESFQLELKRERVVAALAAAGRPPEELRSLAAPEGLGYRCRARFQAEGGPGEILRAGFHVTAGRRTLDVPSCPLLAPELQDSWTALRAALAEEQLRDLSGVELTVLPGSEGALVLLNPRDRPPASWPRLGERLLARGVAVGVGVRGAPAGDAPSSLGLRACLGRSPAGRPVAAGLGGFVQSNLAGADQLCDELVRLAEPRGARVLELHAGAGLLSRALAEAGANVDAVEGDPVSVAAAGRLPPSEHGRFAVRREEASTALQATPRPDLLVVDPPRSGLGGIAPLLREDGPARLVGVWCSLGALERDLAALGPAYRPDSVSVLDLFPQTRHVETLVRLERR